MWRLLFVLDRLLWLLKLFKSKNLVSNFGKSFNFCVSVHCCSVRQTAAIIWMNKEALRTGDKAQIRFRFIKHPEYLRVGTRLVFREGRTKAVGSITKIYHPSETPQKQPYRNRYAPKYGGQGQGAAQSGESGAAGVSHNQGQRFGRRRGGARQRRPPPMGANFSNNVESSSNSQNNSQVITTQKASTTTWCSQQ